MLKLSQDEFRFQSHCQKFPYDLPRSWCFSISWLLGFGVWFGGSFNGGDLNFRRNWFIRMEVPVVPLFSTVACRRH